MFQVQEDHNYGEPGPSTLRHSRRIEQLTQIHRTNETTSSTNNNHSDSPVDPLRIPETNSQSGRSLRTRAPRTNASNVDIDSDPDDDKPLHSLVTESPVRGSSSRSSRQNTRYSDEHISHSQPTGSSSSMATPSSSMRTCRQQKRPLSYLEASDEEDGHRTKRSAAHSSRYV